MDINKIIKNNTGKDYLQERRVRISIEVMMITLLLVIVYSFLNQTDGTFSTLYLVAKILILVIFESLLLATFFVASFRKIFSRLSFLFNLVLYFLFMFFMLIEGVDLPFLVAIITVAIGFYSGGFSRIQVSLFTLLTNVMLIIVFYFSTPNSLLGQFLLIHLVLSSGMLLLNLVNLNTKDDYLLIGQLFEKVYSRLRYPVLLIKPDTKEIIYANYAVIKKFGVDLQKTGIGNLINQAAENSHATFENAFKNILELKGVWEGELVFKDREHKDYFAMISLGYFTIEDQPFIFIKITDISKLKLAEQKLRDSLARIEANNVRLEESKSALVNVIDDVVTERSEAQVKEQKLHAVLESIAEGMVVINLDRKIDMCNDAALKLLGYRQEEFIGMDYLDLLHFIDEKTGQLSEDLINKAFRGEAVNKLSNTALLTREGNILEIMLTVSAILDENKLVNKVVVIFSDATEQRKMEKQRQEFISVASHQLRTPLTGIKWFAELLTDESTNTNFTPEQKTAIQTINESNERMIRLVNDLLNVSRIETGKNYILKPAENDLVALITEVMEEQRVIADARSIKLSFEHSGLESLMLNIDREKIHELIANLLSNAVKYSNPQSGVELKLHKDENNCYLDITDHGIGIPKIDQGRIFQKFFRAENAVHLQTEGTGLGIYISLMIARYHGGDISFVSEPGLGSTFTLKLPLHITIATPQADKPAR